MGAKYTVRVSKHHCGQTFGDAGCARDFFFVGDLMTFLHNFFWCVRCLLITESPKTPSHYKYQIWVLGYIPYTGLAVFSLRFLVFLCILRFRFLKFVFSTLQSRSCFQLANSCLLWGHEGSLLRIDILSYLLPIGIFSRWFVKCLVRLICSRS